MSPVGEHPDYETLGDFALRVHQPAAVAAWVLRHVEGCTECLWTVATLRGLFEAAYGFPVGELPPPAAPEDPALAEDKAWRTAEWERRLRGERAGRWEALLWEGVEPRYTRGLVTRVWEARLDEIERGEPG